MCVSLIQSYQITRVNWLNYVSARILSVSDELQFSITGVISNYGHLFCVCLELLLESRPHKGPTVNPVIQSAA